MRIKSLFGCSDLREDGKKRGENDFLDCLVGRENRRDFGRAQTFFLWIHQKPISFGEKRGL